MQIAAFDDDHRILQLAFQDRIDGRGDVARRCFHPDRAVAAEQAHCPGLVGEATGIGGDVVAVDADELERIGRIVHRAFGDGAGALVDQAHVGPIEQKYADARIGAPQRPVHVTRFDGDHRFSFGLRSVADSRVFTCCARSLASLISASRRRPDVGEALREAIVSWSRGRNALVTTVFPSRLVRV